MNDIISKSRQVAEVAFAKAQSQSLARSRALEEHDLIASSRDEKTNRLREARLAKERQDRENAKAALVAKRAKTS
ncbi:hypothetical protein [Peteryoungia ipomoeae]|uniref:Uncharacterized protein n=1 Tax=Peteryoungia ipomoeae TaxID=1210932 RepID=A0A4S8P1V1_9HYPH|nr:hypothetical protein [Peteryoungia ipomoeae]THV24007.1 hypothetical protein FAA97_08500 [Peteryoungia ipomoeae]